MSKLAFFFLTLVGAVPAGGTLYLLINNLFDRANKLGGVLAMFGAVAILAIISRLIALESVTRATVMGAFLAYALVGFSVAFLYIAVDSLSGDSFFNQGQVPPGDYIYFSLVTLTTVGFGDLTAATEIGKRLVVIEALMGQVFLVVLVARLVSLWKPPTRWPQPKAEPDTDRSADGG